MVPTREMEIFFFFFVVLEVMVCKEYNGTVILCTGAQGSIHVSGRGNVTSGTWW